MEVIHNSLLVKMSNFFRGCNMFKHLAKSAYEKNRTVTVNREPVIFLEDRHDIGFGPVC